ncbi:MAG: hypothetical protein RSE47_06510 [Acidaminococcaceae bacterium]
MIRSLKLICCECQQAFIPTNELFYRDNFISTNLRDAHFICPKCIKKWQAKWQIATATFTEEDYSTYVTITLVDGTSYEHLDCTALDGIVVTSEEIPEAAQHKLFTLFEVWDLKRKANTLKDCTFNDEFMRTTFNCTTYGGESYQNVAFRFNMQGQLETATPIPTYITEQIIIAWKSYQAQNVE